MTEIDDLMDFIRDRIEDDERLARELAAWADGSGRTDGSAIDFDKLIGNPFIGPFGGQSSIRNWGTGQDIAKLADPARVLAEVAAKRRIIARHSVVPSGEELAMPLYCAAHAYRHRDGTVSYPVQMGDCPELRDLAAPYAWHPDYREEWTP